MWSAHEHDVLDALDVHEVIAWADAEAQIRKAMYTVYAVIDIAFQEIAVWVGGVEPTKHRSAPNFRRVLPPGADPIASLDD